MESPTFFGVSVEYFGVLDRLFDYFVLISFRRYGGILTLCDFHRLLGKEALSIACSEKVRGEGQHLRLFQRILPALHRKKPALHRKKSGDSGDIF